MRRFKVFAALPLLCLLPACENSGSNYQPVIDGPVGPNYSNDLAYCQSLAAQQGTFSSNTGATAATGAVVAGGTTAVLNNKGTNVRDAALVGAVAGVAAGALQQQQNKESIVRNCMRGRGYRVVG
ncbi:glycine zipper family protein [Pseudodonghicola flavimaris]|uniref:Glycine zipper family protein n=1 Tax=Pseudodonghicola flavimaris TaxID=3050036 RepID=A0ABT7F895_9RHOB|nr:glycine zipper family protein [Pseudodonghicola flavimaris]MDK3020842.1 glycine zipper family protein [Pseudodonghicola flavimaris]